jgi:hypothetical protein
MVFTESEQTICKYTAETYQNEKSPESKNSEELSDLPGNHKLRFVVTAANMRTTGAQFL